MASVVFSVDFSAGEKIKELHQKILDSREEAAKRGLGPEQGFWVGELLRSPAGTDEKRKGFTFVVLCWDNFRVEFGVFMKELLIRHAFDGLRIIGPD